MDRHTEEHGTHTHTRTVVLDDLIYSGRIKVASVLFFSFLFLCLSVGYYMVAERGSSQTEKLQTEDTTG